MHVGEKMFKVTLHKKNSLFSLPEKYSSELLLSLPSQNFTTFDPCNKIPYFSAPPGFEGATLRASDNINQL